MKNWGCLPQDWFRLQIFFPLFVFVLFQSIDPFENRFQLKSYWTPPSLMAQKYENQKIPWHVHLVWIHSDLTTASPWIVITIVRVTTSNLTCADFILLISGYRVVCFYFFSHSHRSFCQSLSIALWLQVLLWFYPLTIAIYCCYYCVAIHLESIQPNTPRFHKRGVHLHGPCIRLLFFVDPPGKTNKFT